MKDKFLLDILPGYNYKFKVIGLFLLVVLILYASISQFLHLNYIKPELVNWLIAFSLIIISFSKDKTEPNNAISIRYYSGKIAITFIFGFVMAFKLVDLIVKETYSIDIITLAIIALAVYLVSYYILKIFTKGKNIEIEEKTVPETLFSHRRFYYFLFLVSFITLVIIYLIR